MGTPHSAPCDYYNFKDEDIATGKVEVYISETETTFVDMPPDIAWEE